MSGRAKGPRSNLSQKTASGRGQLIEEGQKDDMTPAESRAARELLGLTQEQLADMADLGLSTVQDFELGHPVHDCLVATIQVALEAAGVEFTGGALRLRKDVRV
jgi:hypothetical protein